MTDQEILKIYREAYCSKEASAAAVRGVLNLGRLWPRLQTGAKNVWNFMSKKDILSMPKAWVDDILKWGRRGFKKAPVGGASSSVPPTYAITNIPGASAGAQTAPGLARKSWDFIKRHPYSTGVAGTAVLGGGGVYAGSKYMQAQREAHPLYGISQFIKENPKMALMLLGGALSAPFWLPPVVGALTGRRDGGNGSGYQMGYYPGR